MLDAYTASSERVSSSIHAMRWGANSRALASRRALRQRPDRMVMD